MVAGPAVGAIAGMWYYLLVTGKVTLDTGWGRRVRPLGRSSVPITAPAATVFDVIAAPCLGRTPRAVAAHLRVIAPGTNMVLAGHYTPVHHGRLTGTTLETVTFDRPGRAGFPLAAARCPTSARRFPHRAQRYDHACLFGRAGHRLRDRRAVAGRSSCPRLGGSGPRLIHGHPGRSWTPPQARCRPRLTATVAVILGRR